MRAMAVFPVIFAIWDFATASNASPDASGSCDAGFTLCSPPGATNTNTPQIGSADFQNLFVDIVESSLPASKRSLPHLVRASTSLCCNAQLSCLTMATLALPFCYDKFTTNFFLPDGSTGTVVGGSYKSAGGDIANLETGNYTLANGQTGNIYSANPAAKPNTATLPMPSQFTSSGVGSAIPVASLGSQIIVTYTTTLPGSTIPGKTVSPSVMPGTTSTETILLPTTTTTSAGSGSSVSVGIITSYSVVDVAASTIPGTTLSASTASPTVETIITTQFSEMAASSTSSPSATTKKNDASGFERRGGCLWIMSTLFLLF